MAAPMKPHEDKEISEENGSIKRPRLDTNEVRLAQFIDWCKSEHLVLSDKIRIGKDGSCAQYGMVAVDTITPGETLFTIPRPMLLTPQTCGIADVLMKEWSKIQSQSGWVPLLLALMHEHTNSSSKWQHYLRLVPDFDQLDLPMFWAKEEQDSELAHTGVMEAVNTDISFITKEFNSIVLPFVKKHSNLFPEQCQDRNFYRRMVSFVMAYSFTEPLHGDSDSDSDGEGEIDEEKSPPMMVPMADILNHVAKNNARLDFGTDSLKMVATKHMKKDDEIFNTYGQLANCQLLHMYGFAEPHPNNHYDTVDIPMRELHKVAVLEASDTECKLQQDKWEFLKSMGLVSDDGIFVLGVEGVLTEDELYQSLRVLSMTEEQFKEHRQKEGWSDDEGGDGNTDLLTNKDIPLLPLERRKWLVRLIDHSLAYYKHSVEDEKTLIEDGTAWNKLTFRQKRAAHVRYGQLRILHGIRKLCIDSSS